MNQLSFFKKFYLKIFNKQAYKTYKWELINRSNVKYSALLMNSGRLNSLSKISQILKSGNILNISHGGHAGDIIYALATIKRIHDLTSARINLYFVIGKPSNLINNYNHPLGGVMLNKKTAEMLLPLIKQQTYVVNCKILESEEVDIDLDYFRAGLIRLDRGNIARWCGYITGVTPVLYKPWLNVKPNLNFAEKIILARSGRYQNKAINYSVLNKLENLIFIGLEDEYLEMKIKLPAIKWEQFSNFYEMACHIAGCKFFIGNQSFPYAIAEALKVPRLLELSFDVINVVPEGENAYDFLFQEHFEDLVELLNI